VAVRRFTFFSKNFFHPHSGNNWVEDEKIDF
jgi:hypothetical protein